MGISERKMNDNTKIWLKERISRFRPVVFIKKNLPIFLFLLFFFLSLIFGVWKIRKYEIYDENWKMLDEKVNELVSDYLNTHILGDNFFLTYTHKVSEDLCSNISYVKSAEVSKSVPNKLTLLLTVFQPKSVMLGRDNKCRLLSQDGVVLEEICKDSEDVSKCCVDFISNGNYYLFRSEDVDISQSSDKKERLLVMRDISNIVRIVESFGNRIKEITLKDGVVDIVDSEGRVSRFTVSEDIHLQTARYFLVMGKIRSDAMSYSLIDVRFERPVVKN